jgi:hypothetical protein
MSERLSAGMLLSTTDASVWAREFCAIAGTLGHPNIDEGWMIGWFANAMAAQKMAMTSQVQPADFRVPMPKVNPAPPPMPEEASDWNFDPEQPEQPSTETMVETKRPFPTKMSAAGVPHWEELTEKEIEALKADEIEGAPAPLPVKPLTDLTGVGCAPAFEGYQPNGALPETD